MADKENDNINKLVHVDCDFTYKLEENDNFFIFEGYGSTFGNIDQQHDVVVKGAFAESLVTRTPVILWQHDWDQPVGVPEIAVEDAKGLKLRVRMPKDDSFVTNRVMPQLRIGSIHSMSVGIRVKEFTIKEGVRFIEKADLREISLVTFPANIEAKITEVKQFDVLDIEKMNKRDLEKHLRESGLFTKNAAVMIASKFPKETGEPSSIGINTDAILNKCKILDAKSDVANQTAILEKIQSIANA